VQLSSRFGANGTGRLQILWNDGGLAFCRGSRDNAEGGRESALIILPASEQPTPAILDRLAHEYSFKDELDGTWAVRPLELTRDRGQTVLVLEDTGGQLLGMLLETPMEVGRFLRIAVGVAAALGKVHQHGLVHKDIKPSNILVNSSSGEVQLTGFGIASRLPRERQAPDPPEIIAGTLAYMAPEQTGRMNRSVDSRSDLYSLGVTLYETLTGGLPFTASDPLEWVHCHIARKPTPPNARLDTIPATVSAIVMKLLAKTAEERYQTAVGVERDLRRCLAEWERGSLTDFPLAEEDAPDRLLIPEKLYGRERDIETLLASFDRVVKSGAPELVLVSGYSGIGKSSVVNELHPILVPPRGLFAAGKFDQFKRDIPYATVAQAFQSLVRQILSKNEAELQAWRESLREAVGPNGQLMVNLIPELELILGKQPPVPDLPAQDAHNRFQMVFGRFLAAFARPEHPLALFLDDLQWLDTATLDLLEHLITSIEVKHLLLIGAYRDNEVGPAHPLTRRLEAIRKAKASVQGIALGPLCFDDISRLVADTLRCESLRIRQLAELVHEKTGGNPFFATQFLTALVEEHLLYFDARETIWRWEIDRLRAKGYTENVVDLMVAKLQRLSRTTQSSLQRLSCLGNAVQITIFATAQGCSEEALHTDLREAVHAGLVLRSDTAFRFLHDRVQEAAYALIPPVERAAMHLRIGRLLVAARPQEAMAERVFEVVNQFNRGRELVVDPAETDTVCRLNAVAGRRARDATAYASARHYLAQAAAFLPSNSWTDRYEESFAINLDLAECEYMVGNFEQAEMLFSLLLAKARSATDRARVYRLQMQVYQVSGRPHDAVTAALDALKLFGVTFPDSDEATRAASEHELHQIPLALGNRNIGELLDAPVPADPDVRTIISLLGGALAPTYIARPHLFPLVVAKAVNFFIRFGNTEESCHAYTCYGAILVSLSEDISAGFAVSEMALRLNEKFKDAKLKGRVLLVHGALVNSWKRPLETSLSILDQAYTACMQVGDFPHASYGLNNTAWLLLEKGEPLDVILDAFPNYTALAKQIQNETAYNTLMFQQRLLESLKGVVRTAPEDDAFDEIESVAFLEQANFSLGIAVYHITKMVTAFTFGRHSEALVIAAKAEAMRSGILGMIHEMTCSFYHVLSMTALYPQATVSVRRHYKQAIDRHRQKFELWAQNCPENFLGRLALLTAEIARIEGREIEAMRGYEDAIRLLQENGVVHIEGLSHELAAQFCAARGLGTIADAYLRNARHCYLRWGALGKVKQLDELYPLLSEAGPSPAGSGSIGAPLEYLDVATVTKLSQALSSEIVFEKLIQQLMAIAIEHAGADRGLLMLCTGEDAQIEAEAKTRCDGLEVCLIRTPATESELPLTILHYVLRTRNSVVLSDALVRHEFSSDGYLARNRCRSVFCLPLVRQVKLIGVLYLENSLAPGAFSPARASLLKVLASQAAISLENSHLYRELAEREGRIRRLVEANIIGICIFDIDGRIIEANEAFLRIVGYGHDDLISGGLRWTALTPPEWSGADDQALAELAASGTCKPFEKEYFRKDGSRVPVLVGGTTFGELRHQGVAFVLDLTERKRVEAELAHANRVATMGQLTASIAHEINQPLAAMLTNAETAVRWLAGQPPNLEKAKSLIDRIVGDGKRGADIVNRIRDFSKKAPVRNEDLEINEAILEIMGLTRVAMSEHCVSATMRLSEGLPHILGDRIQLQQVMLNLIMNAIEAMSEVSDGSRELLISTSEAASGDVLVKISDSGPGLPSANSERLFEAFYTTKASGLGMGLSICRSIIDAHGGRLWATRNEPQGAVFCILLPIGERSLENLESSEA
jgi:PAS domain S-box-containing protein